MYLRRPLPVPPSLSPPRSRKYRSSQSPTFYQDDSRSTIRTLSITESVIGNRPSDFARLLALLPYLRALRIKGNTFTGSSRISSPRLDCGRLISFNSLLYKTLSSPNNLQTLEQLEIIECSATQILIDIIAAIRSYNRLVFRRSRVVHEPDLMDHTNCNVKIVEIYGMSFRYANWMGQFLQRTRICATVELLSLPATSYGSVAASLHDNHSKIEDVFPKLRTLYFSSPSPANSYSSRHGLKRKLTFKTVVLRINSFLRDTSLDHVFPFPLQPSNVNCSNGAAQRYSFLTAFWDPVFDFQNILETSVTGFFKTFIFHQSARIVIFHSKHQNFGIEFLKPRRWDLPGNANIPFWDRDRITRSDIVILEPQEIDRILQDADMSLWPEYM